MCASWKEGYDPNLLAKGLEEIRLRDSAGKHEGFRAPYEDYVTVLHSSLKFKDVMPEVERRRIISISIRTVAIRGSISPKALIAEISKQENLYFALPLKKFALAPSISIQHDRNLNQANMPGASIRFDPRLPKHFVQKPLLDKAHKWVFGKLPADYCSARVFLSARSEHEAAENALNVLDLLRGFWNLRINSSIGLPFHSGSRKPLNKILPGPIHTLHEPSGKLAAADFLWYEPEYVGPVEVYRVHNGLGELREFERWIRARLKKVAYPGVVEHAIRRYSRALDSRDFKKAFLELWAVLESLTSFTTDRYDVTIRRALSIWAEADFHRQILEHLREFRNKAVHAGETNEEVEVLLSQLRRYVEQLIF
ncbi:MAG TPA: hypothetical protein VFM05_12255, partial [Candidatus Saccharimonadales bacterium]|nr:hypothetical protein [Candidatus Saccharimonadales bacterium]